MATAIGLGLFVGIVLSGCGTPTPWIDTIASRPQPVSSGLAGAFESQGADPADRLELLNLIHLYSHLADGLHTELFGQFFTEDAVFAVVSQGTAPGTPPETLGVGRAAIVESLRPRHEAFRRDAVQRRHFLTNPVVWDQTEDTARVSVYLQLRTSERGGPSRLVATGRYVGLARKTTAGWRMSEWTIHSDQRLE